jgi:AraC-like DNA-binding protein
MFRYVRSQKTSFTAQALTIYHDHQCYYTCIHHTAVGQDRPMGQADTFREHQHNLYHVVVYTKSHGAFSYQGKVIDAPTGTVVCVSPGQWHDFVTYRGQAVYSEVTFSFETEEGHVLEVPFERLLQMLTGLALTLKPWQIIAPERARHLESLILRITDHVRSGSETAAYCSQVSLASLLDALVWACAELPKSASGADERLVAVRQFIEKNYADPIAVDELASLAGMSKGYLFRAFKASFGLPPLAYQQQLRLEAAKTLLRATALRCREVALRCGYENSQFFCRLFKRANGVSPGRFRKQMVPHGPTDGEGHF